MPSRIQDTTAGTTRPIITEAGTIGFFEHGNKILGTPGTKVTVDWANDVQETYMDLFERTGITPLNGPDGDRNLYDAIMVLVNPKLDTVTADVRYVKKSGDTMTGFLTLHADPITNLHAATKKYVDDQITAHTFPSYTRMPFAQAIAPPGWTQDTSDTANNRLLRVVNTSGGGVGGSSDPTLLNVVPSHTHSFTSGGQSAGHTHGFLTGNENQSHNHGFVTGGQSQNHTHNYNTKQWTQPQNGSSTPCWWGDAAGTTTGASNDHTHSGTTYYENQAHNHSGTTYGVSANHTHSGTSDANSGATNWTPRYINMIIATRN